MYQLKSFDSVLCFSRLISLLFPTSSLKNIIAMSILTNLTSVYILLPNDVRTSPFIFLSQPPAKSLILYYSYSYFGKNSRYCNMSKLNIVECPDLSHSQIFFDCDKKQEIQPRHTACLKKTTLRDNSE